MPWKNENCVNISNHEKHIPVPGNPKCKPILSTTHGRVPFRDTLYNADTVCQRSLDPFYIEFYYITWVKTSWTYSTLSFLIFLKYLPLKKCFTKTGNIPPFPFFTQFPLFSLYNSSPLLYFIHFPSFSLYNSTPLLYFTHIPLFSLYNLSPRFISLIFLYFPFVIHFPCFLGGVGYADFSVLPFHRIPFAKTYLRTCMEESRMIRKFRIKANERPMELKFNLISSWFIIDSMNQQKKIWGLFFMLP